MSNLLLRELKDQILRKKRLNVKSVIKDICEVHANILVNIVVVKVTDPNLNLRF